MDKKVIDFEKPQSWLELVEESLSNPAEYFDRLCKSKIEYSCWDCSGLDHVFSDAELSIVINKISDNLSGYSLRLYHGCRLYDGEDPMRSGLKTSSTQGIEAALLEIAKKDVVLKNYLEKIRTEIAAKFTREQAECRNGQIWFCIRYKEMIEEGGVYCVFGSEYRLIILNAIDGNLKERLLYYGTPAILVLNIPVDKYLEYFRNYAAKYLFSLWIHHKLQLDEINFPSGFACYLRQDIPAELIDEIITPEKVYDRYNVDGRWYRWEEMFRRDEILSGK